MTSRKSLFAAALAGAVGLSFPAVAQEVVEVQEVTVMEQVPPDAAPFVVEADASWPVAYCHMKIPELEEGTVGTAEPRFKDRPGRAGFIDFYGPCNTDPVEVALENSEELDDFEKEMS
jgi:hypothetical protein